MVIKQVKQWFVARANAARWKPVAEWAEGRGGGLRHSRDGHGFVLEFPRALPGPLRVEWGPSQRGYLPGHELRMRCELRLSNDLQMMVLCRQLMETLETTVFEAYTDTLKTRVDTDTPEEMRWLVMFPKFNQFTSKLVRQRFGALGVTRELPAAWLEGELSEALAQASQELLPDERPFVMMSLRGNLYLRTTMAEVSLPQIQSLVKLLEVACHAAQRANLRLSEGAPWPTTSSVAWQSQTPEDEPPLARPAP